MQNRDGVVIVARAPIGTHREWAIGAGTGGEGAAKGRNGENWIVRG